MLTLPTNRFTRPSAPTALGKRFVIKGVPDLCKTDILAIARRLNEKPEQKPAHILHLGQILAEELDAVGHSP